jgi:hypothetical protein
MSTAAISARHYPVRIAQDGTRIRKGGAGPWYVYDSTKDEVATWVGHNTKRAAQSIADERNTSDAGRPFRLVR